MSSFPNQATDPQAPIASAITYLCGDCGSSVDIRPADAIRCRECGCRVIYKLRNRNKPMVYEAR